MKTIGISVLVQFATVSAFAPVLLQRAHHGLSLDAGSDSTSTSTGTPNVNPESTSTADASALKTQLLSNIAVLNRLQGEDGKISIDFGVKGGEIDEKSRAPKKLDFYTVSDRVGKAADDVFETVDRISLVNPTAAATAGFEGPDCGPDCGDSAATVTVAEDEASSAAGPLDGTWRLLFSTAADANFSKDSKRGDAMAMNIVDSKLGRITNVIRFALGDNGKPKFLEELRVSLKATAEGPNRINLVFKRVALKFTKLFFFPIKWTFYIPLPGPGILKFFIAIGNLKNRLLRRNNDKRKVPKAFFDVLYLDKDLRVHKTGESNIFIQARPDWTTAWEIAG